MKNNNNFDNVEKLKDPFQFSVSELSECMGVNLCSSYIRNVCVGILLLLNTHISCKLITGFVLSFVHCSENLPYILHFTL